MHITFMGPLKRPPAQILENATRTASTIKELLTKLGYSENQHRFVQVFADGERLDLGDSLPQADEIILVLPMGGG